MQSASSIRYGNEKIVHVIAQCVYYALYVCIYSKMHTAFALICKYLAFFLD